MSDRCGVGGCTMPAGHNRGRAAIPESHALADTDSNQATWGATGTWVTEGGEPLFEVKHAANARNVAEDHNALLIERNGLAAQVETVRAVRDEFEGAYFGDTGEAFWRAVSRALSTPEASRG